MWEKIYLSVVSGAGLGAIVLLAARWVLILLRKPRIATLDGVYCRVGQLFLVLYATGVILSRANLAALIEDPEPWLAVVASAGAFVLELRARQLTSSPT